MSYIDSLNPILPTQYAQMSDVAGFLRTLKAVLLATFPNLSGPVTSTQEELNLVVPTASRFPSGTHALFFDAAPPTGWTIDTAVTVDLFGNHYYIRVNNTSGGQLADIGGSGVDNTYPDIGGVSGSHTLTDTELPAHTHTYTSLVPGATGTNAWYAVTAGTTGDVVGDGNMLTEGNGGSHVHVFGAPGVGSLVDSNGNTGFLPYMNCVIGVKT